MARLSEVAMKHATFSVESSSRRGIVCLGEWGSRSGEKVSPKREIGVSHCLTLAQARKSSLSETDALAWAKIPSLSENSEELCVHVLFEFVYFYNSEIIYMCLWCWAWRTKSIGSGMCLAWVASEELVMGGPHAECERFSSPEVLLFRMSKRRSS